MVEKQLPNEFRAEAERMALLPYSVIVIRDEDADGNPVFIAVNPELDGCMADGKSSEEAIENLKDARADFIQVLLLNGEQVPTPGVTGEISAHQAKPVAVTGTFVYENKGTQLPDIPGDGEKIVAEYSYKWLPLNA